MKKNEFKARVSMAFGGIPTWDDFLEECWQVHNEEVEQLGWHLASELSELKEGALGDSKVVFAVDDEDKPVKVFYSKTNNCWVTVEGFDTIRIKFWCYPPKEE